MLVLSLDTTTRASSCAVARDGAVLREEGGDPAHDAAERLPADLMALLAHAGLSLRDVDVFAVATGPGSFTALRIGIATMQGLAFATGKPLVGISGFDALASIAGQGSGYTATWIDAWRGEVYAALYQDGRAVEAPVVSHPAPLLERLRGLRSPITFIGDAAATCTEVIRGALGEDASIAAPAAPLLAGAVATLAARGPLPPPHAIRPLYVRRSDAELARNRR